MKDKTRILLIDDGENYADIILKNMPELELIHPFGSNKSPCISDGPTALDYISQNRESFDVILLDMRFDISEEKLFPLGKDFDLRRTRQFQGVAILRKIREKFSFLPIVLLTSVEDISLVDIAHDLESESMTYFFDGSDVDTLRVRVNRAMAESSLSKEVSGVLWGTDPAMKSVRRRLAVMARGSMPVILEGETGTGKSYLAEKYVHVKSGRTGPFVVLDLSTVPTNLVSAHLFGAVKGAYTGATETRKGVFEIANHGTLFIDEIQNAPLDVQKQLLLVLQDKKVSPLGASSYIGVDVKVIAASNTKLDKAVEEGIFRPDLYMRLSPATRVIIPPLRNRLFDLEFLARRFVSKAAKEQDVRVLIDEVAAALGMPPGLSLQLLIGREKSDFSTQSLEIVIPAPAWQMLTEHKWPGNIRELEMVVFNLVIFTLVDILDAAKGNMSISSSRLQVDPALVSKLLKGTAINKENTENKDHISIHISHGKTLNDVAKNVERQYYLHLYHKCKKDFFAMAEILLGDPSRARAVRLRFNQLGLKVREL